MAHATRGRPFLHFHRFGDRFRLDVRTAGGFRRIDIPAEHIRDLEDLLGELRQIEGVVEPNTGLFRYADRDATSRHQIARKIREALEGLR